MKNLRWIATVMLATASPLIAQESATPAATEAAVVDPERLAMAGRVIERIWPAGTLRRMMEAQTSAIADSAEPMVEAAAGIDEDSKEARRARHAARTGRPLPGAPAEATPPGASVADMTAQMTDLMDRLEPGFRDAMTRVYARRYTVAQLTELDAFFATPTGSAYASDSLTLMNEPEMAAAMDSVMRETMRSLFGFDADVAGAPAADAATATAAADAAAAAATTGGWKAQ